MRSKIIFSGMILAYNLIFFNHIAYGQAEGPMQKLESMRIAFFTERLALTSSEAEKFWPVYRDYNNRKEKINEERRSLIRYISKNGDYLSEKEINESLGKYLTLQKDETNLSEIFNQKFLEILPAKKVLKIYITENQFKAYILNQIKENRQVAPRQKGRNF
jgi:hypothetical protein